MRVKKLSFFSGLLPLVIVKVWRIVMSSGLSCGRLYYRGGASKKKLRRKKNYNKSTKNSLYQFWELASQYMEIGERISVYYDTLWHFYSANWFFGTSNIFVSKFDSAKLIFCQKWPRWNTTKSLETLENCFYTMPLKHLTVFARGNVVYAIPSGGSL